MRPGNKHFVSGLLGIIVGGTPFTSTLCFLDPLTLTVGETTDSGHIQFNGDPCPSTDRQTHLAGSETKSSKSHSSVLSSYCFRMVGNEMTSEFHEHEPLAALLL